MPSGHFDANALTLELLDPGSVSLVRLFRPARHAEGDWEAPEPEYRTLRVDPPAGHRDRFAVLYTADTLPCVAAECRILSADTDDNWTWRGDLAAQYQVVRYAFAGPAIFVPIDHPNAKAFGLPGGPKTFNSYAPFQDVALELFERFGTIVHGLSWASFHRDDTLFVPCRRPGLASLSGGESRHRTDHALKDQGRPRRDCVCVRRSTPTSVRRGAEPASPAHRWPQRTDVYAPCRRHLPGP